jgi:hypothetical protein
MSSLKKVLPCRSRTHAKRRPLFGRAVLCVCWQSVLQTGLRPDPSAPRTIGGRSDLRRREITGTALMEWMIYQVCCRRRCGIPIPSLGSLRLIESKTFPVRSTMLRLQPSQHSSVSGSFVRTSRRGHEDLGDCGANIGGIDAGIVRQNDSVLFEVEEAMQPATHVKKPHPACKHPDSHFAIPG